MKTIGSFFVLFAIVVGVGATIPAAFADHAEVTIETVAGSGFSQDCISDGCYAPSTVTVDVGGVVIFSNTDVRLHTFTSFTDLSDTTIGTEFGLTEGIIRPGESFEWIPKIVGDVTYFCMIHPWMQGLIIVQEAEKDMGNKTMMGDDNKTMMGDDNKTMMGDDNKTMMGDDNKTMMGDEKGGGCLIATAAFGSELAPQVQQLRELRNNIILSTKSGTAFMTGFNQFYYSFSPTIADLERESPVFKEVVRLTLTPLLSSLSLLNYVDIDSEQEMLVYGISLILLNIGMYVGIPAFGILKLCQFKKN